MAPAPRVVHLPQERWPRWLENFRAAHGDTVVEAEGSVLSGSAADGSSFVAHWPWGAPALGPAPPPGAWGVLLVRKGGFAVARMAGDRMVEHKVGQRHVQGRTKAGGQSQQRFARRRENQARQAYEAAAGHARRILRPGPVVVGGDRGAVEEVLAQLDGMEVVGPWLAVPDPRRRELDQAIADAQGITVEVTNA